MAFFKLANVLLEDTKQFYAVPSIYCRADAPVLPSEDGSWELRGPGSFDFSTYFNALSVGKFKRYTVAQSFILHLELKGSACRVVPTRGDSYTVSPVKMEESAAECHASEDWVAFDMVLNPKDDDVLVAFEVETEGSVKIRNSFYQAEVDDALIRPVELSVATTTFKKEAYILSTVKRLKERILDSDEDIAEHFYMHVVDNGKTLTAEQIESPHVFLHPNPNVGGAGGFTRGMIEAMDQDPVATHVLLMDDDVVVSPESVIRTYNILRIVKDEYRRALVSGTMMQNENPSFCFEDYAFWTNAGACVRAKPRVNAEHFPSIVLRECQEMRPDIKGYDDQAQTYAAWWFCAIPMDVIKENGLPLPIFVRLDDVEYGMRCKCPIITMNGICLWHDAFEFRYNYVQERYQSVRNALIIKAVTGVGGLAWVGVPNEDGYSLAGMFMEHDLSTYNYQAAELVVQALEDYIAGPEMSLAPGFGEERFIGLSRSLEKLLPISEVAKILKDEYGIEYPEMTAFDVDFDVPWSQDDADYFFSTKNGQLSEKVREKDVGGVLSRFVHRREAAECDYKGTVPEAVAPFMGLSQDGSIKWAAVDWRGDRGQFAKAFGRDLLVAVDVTTGKAAIRLKDEERCRELWNRFESDLDILRNRGEEIESQYASVCGSVTSREFWEDYLSKCAKL